MKAFIAAAAALILATGPVATRAAEPTLGGDGLYKQPWFETTFKDVREDWETAKAEGKRLAILFEQAGCVYCRKLHKDVLSDKEIAKYIADNYIVVQYNLYGDEEVTDLDGETLTEKSAARRWGVLFTPTFLFLPDDPNAAGAGALKDVVVSTMPGAFGKGTTLDMFAWVRAEGYLGDEGFQRYHARRIRERADGSAE